MTIEMNESFLKNYILWPTLALLSTGAIYLVLTLYLYKTFITYNFTEEILWERFVKNDLVIVDDNKKKNLQNIIDNLPKELLPSQYKKIQIIITRNNEINAFAAPGGRIILTTSLLEAVKNEKALLFAIGHEIGHLYKQDHLYELSRMITLKLYNILTFSELFADALGLIDNVKIKNNEFFADQHALRIVYYKYNQIKGIEELFYTLKYLDLPNKTKQILLTHPNINERVEKLNFLIKKRPKK